MRSHFRARSGPINWDRRRRRSRGSRLFMAHLLQKEEPGRGRVRGSFRQSLPSADTDSSGSSWPNRWALRLEPWGRPQPPNKVELLLAYRSVEANGFPKWPRPFDTTFPSVTSKNVADGPTISSRGAAGAALHHFQRRQLSPGPVVPVLLSERPPQGLVRPRMLSTAGTRQPGRVDRGRFVADVDRYSRGAAPFEFRCATRRIGRQKKKPRERTARGVVRHWDEFGVL